MTEPFQISDAEFQRPDDAQLFDRARSLHPPRVLLLYGSLRARSFSRLMS